jgi:hypothetical protein
MASARIKAGPQTQPRRAETRELLGSDILTRCAWAADRQSRAARLAWVLVSVAAGPRKAAVP